MEFWSDVTRVSSECRFGVSFWNFVLECRFGMSSVVFKVSFWSVVLECRFGVMLEKSRRQFALESFGGNLEFWWKIGVLVETWVSQPPDSFKKCSQT